MFKFLPPTPVILKFNIRDLIIRIDIRLYCNSCFNHLRDTSCFEASVYVEQFMESFYFEMSFILNGLVPFRGEGCKEDQRHFVFQKFKAFWKYITTLLFCCNEFGYHMFIFKRCLCFLCLVFTGDLGKNPKKFNRKTVVSSCWGKCAQKHIVKYKC